MCDARRVRRAGDAVRLLRSAGPSLIAALFVSHRFSTVRMADHIVVLAGGRVVEEGDHGALMAREGMYRELYDIQARAYE